MAVNFRSFFRSFVLAFACISIIGLAGLVSAQPPAPTADRPHLAKDAKEAMDFLATWVRVTSGEEHFKGATYVGSESCRGSGCHDQQIQEWRTTWHSKILRVPSAETVNGDFNNAVIPFQNIRSVAKGHDADLAKLQNVPVKFDENRKQQRQVFFRHRRSKRYGLAQERPEIRSGVGCRRKVAADLSRPSGRQRRQSGRFLFPGADPLVVESEPKPRPAHGRMGSWQFPTGKLGLVR